MSATFRLPVRQTAVEAVDGQSAKPRHVLELALCSPHTAQLVHNATVIDDVLEHFERRQTHGRRSRSFGPC
jgi:hypothetical protein